MIERSIDTGSHDPLADGPIEEGYREVMNMIAQAVDKGLNPFEGKRKIGFVLLTFQFGIEGSLNYISNAERTDIVVMMKEILARFEGFPETSGSA